MELQKTFKSSYVKYLKNNIDIEKYKNDSFEYDSSNVKNLAYRPYVESSKLLESMLSAENDFEAARLLFEAYKDIPLVLAANEDFWAYLNHTDLFLYAKKRWGSKITDKKTTILDHWFFGSSGTNYEDNALAGLWWSIYVSYDELNISNPYHLSEIFFKNYTFRVVSLRVALRMKECLLGTLTFLKENTDVMETNFEMRGRFIAKYINTLGGSKENAYMSRDYFKEKLEKVKYAILNVPRRTKSENDSIDLYHILAENGF
jgi:hypothetical protein